MKEHSFIWKFLHLLLIAGFLRPNGDVLNSESSDLQILGSHQNRDDGVYNSESGQWELPVLRQNRNGAVLYLESRESREFLRLGSHQNQLEPVTRSPGRRLHSHTPENEPRTALVAALNGTVQFRDLNSDRTIWSFTSGPSIYTSYQAQNSGYYIDYGDEWTLYEHSPHFGRRKLPYTIADYVNKAPKPEEDGSVILGSKMTTVFDVGLFTGTIYRTFPLSNSLSTLNGKQQRILYDNHNKDNKELVKSGLMNQNAGEPRLRISRTDYILESYDPHSGNLSWRTTFSEIRAVMLCKDIETLFGGSETGSGIALPFACRSKKLIFPHRNHMLESEDQHIEVPKPAPGLIVPSHPEVDNMFSNWLKALAIACLFVILVGFVVLLVYHHASVVKGQGLFARSNFGSKTAPSKRKKSRRSGKNSGIEKTENASSQDVEALTHTEGDNKSWSFLNKLFDSGINGRRIGKLLISDTEISKGSNGTIVLEGVYEGRPVAVKRLVLAHHDVASKEIQNLIASDRHPNIVRWYGVEYDKDFVYISLERCICNLDDLIRMCSDSSQNTVDGEEDAKRFLFENEVHLESVKNILPNVNLWKAGALPSPLLLKLMRDVVSGLVHLHDLGIIHRDLKPQNVLLIKERYLSAKLSDMGISKRLIGDMSSLGHRATGCGSSGWQASEQLLHGRQTRAVDLFSLGCVLFYCITGGRHPFGDHLERDINIVKNQMDIFLIEHIPEAVDLISCLLNPDPELRPKALEVLHHPLFWNAETRLSFLRDASDRVELEDREANSIVLKALENISPLALGGKWDEKMEPAFLTNIGHYRRYKYDSVRDLLRVIRNKSNHYRELPNQIQELVGPVPEGFDSYFASRFPRLLLEVYKVVYTHCREEECFGKYFNSIAD